jgi:hypothetical protein
MIGSEMMANVGSSFEATFLLDVLDPAIPQEHSGFISSKSKTPASSSEAIPLTPGSAKRMVFAPGAIGA